MIRTRGWVALVLGLPLRVLGAQETPALAPGARVRVSQPSSRRAVVGSLEALDSTTIVVRVENGSTVTLTRDRDTQLDVSRGPGSCSGGRRGGCLASGFLIGAAAGGALGFLYVLTQGGASSSNCSENLCELVYWFTVSGGAVVGTIVGAVVGGEQWQSVDAPIRLTGGPAGSGRFALGLAVRF